MSRFGLHAGQPVSFQTTDDAYATRGPTNARYETLELLPQFIAARKLGSIHLLHPGAKNRGRSVFKRHPLDRGGTGLVKPRTKSLTLFGVQLLLPCLPIAGLHELLIIPFIFYFFVPR